MDENRLMGDARGVPWKLPDDVAHFRASTAGKWLLLGRRTYEEMLGWFHPDHHPLVLSERCGWDPQVGRLVSSVPQALALAALGGADELMCCGGAQTFAAALPYASRLLLTRVQARTEPEGSPAYFPEWKADEWRDVTLWSHARDSEHPHPFALHELTRRH